MMNTTCKKDDLELLMSVHGEGSPIKQFVLKRHISKCADCRKRIEEFSVVSTTFKEVLRAGVPTPTASFTPPSTQFAAARARRVLIGAVAVFAVAFAIVSAWVVMTRDADKHSQDAARPLLKPGKNRSNLLGPTPLPKNQ